jgi:hypothetical protein
VEGFSWVVGHVNLQPLNPFISLFTSPAYHKSCHNTLSLRKLSHKIEYRVPLTRPAFRFDQLASSNLVVISSCFKRNRAKGVKGKGKVTSGVQDNINRTQQNPANNCNISAHHAHSLDGNDQSSSTPLVRGFRAAA